MVTVIAVALGCGFPSGKDKQTNKCCLLTLLLLLPILAYLVSGMCTSLIAREVDLTLPDWREITKQ